MYSVLLRFMSSGKNFKFNLGFQFGRISCGCQFTLAFRGLKCHFHQNLTVPVDSYTANWNGIEAICDRSVVSGLVLRLKYLN